MLVPCEPLLPGRVVGATEGSLFPDRADECPGNVRGMAEDPERTAVAVDHDRFASPEPVQERSAPSERVNRQRAVTVGGARPQDRDRQLATAVRCKRDPLARHLVPGVGADSAERLVLAIWIARGRLPIHVDGGS